MFSKESYCTKCIYECMAFDLSGNIFESNLISFKTFI